MTEISVINLNIFIDTAKFARYCMDGVIRMEYEHYLSLHHPMTREHFISFLAYVTTDRVQVLKLYPEQEAEGRFLRRGPGKLYAYCNRHGLFEIKV